MAAGIRAAVAALGAGLALFFLFNGLWLWFRHEPLTLSAFVAGRGDWLPFGRLRQLVWIVPAVLLSFAAARALRRRPDTFPWTTPFRPTDREPAFPLLCAALLFASVSGAPGHPWAYFLGWGGRTVAGGRIFWNSLKTLLSLTLLLTPLFAGIPLPRKGGGIAWRALPDRWRPDRLLWILLFCAQALAFRALLETTHGLPIYSDDHPSFLFRLHEFAHTFPRRIDYNPCWNAGVVNWTSTSSGTSGPGLLFLPLWRWLPAHAVYTPLFGILFILVVPWLAALAMRAVRAGSAAAAVAGLLALCPSRYYFLWLLHFGTIGSCFATAVYPLFAALTYRILSLRARDGKTLLGWVASAFFLTQWPPGAIMAALLLPGALLDARRWRWRPVGRLAAGALLLALLVAPSALMALFHGKDLFAFVGKGAVVGGGGESARAALPAFDVWRHFLLDTMGKRLTEAHPLLLFFGVAGAFALPWKHLRRWFALPVALLFLLAAWGPLLARRMQLERMALPAIQLAIVPAAAWVGAGLRGRRPAFAFLRALLLAALVAGALNTRLLYRAKGYAPFRPQPRQIADLAAWVRENVPADARLLFLGKNVHSYGGGHIAYLPVLAGREMMASDYYGFPPGMIDEKYPPRPYRKLGAEGIARFARLHRATHLVASREGYVDEFRLRDHPGLFREVRELNDDGFFLFEVLDPSPSLFHKGTGAVRATFNRIDVAGLAGQEDVVIRYNWDPRLRVGSPAEIYPVEIENGIVFIGIRPHGADKATIRLGGIL